MLTARDLHASLSDPSLTVMTFLNEVTLRYPDAVSFAPRRAGRTRASSQWTGCAVTSTPTSIT